MSDTLTCPSCGHEQSIVTDICGFCGASMSGVNDKSKTSAQSYSEQNVTPTPITSSETEPRQQNQTIAMNDDIQPTRGQTSPVLEKTSESKTIVVGEGFSRELNNQANKDRNSILTKFRAMSLRRILLLSFALVIIVILVIVIATPKKKTSAFTQSGYLSKTGAIKGYSTFVTSCYGLQIPNAMKTQTNSSACIISASNDTSPQNAIEFQPSQLYSDNLTQAVLDTKQNYTNKGYVISGEKDLTINGSPAHEIDSLTDGVYFRNYIIRTNNKYLIGKSSYQYFVLTATSSNGQWSFMDSVLSSIKWQ